MAGLDKMTAYAPVHDDEIEDDTAQLIHRDGEPSSSGADDSKDHPPRVAVPIGKGKGDYALLGALCTSVFFSGCLGAFRMHPASSDARRKSGVVSFSGLSSLRVGNSTGAPDARTDALHLNMRSRTACLGPTFAAAACSS